MDHVTQEIETQPRCWLEAAARASGHAAELPQTGERVAVVGCGTSWFMAQAYAARREELGRGETDAFAASETPRGRRYDRVVAITRSGTTTEVLDLLAAFRGRVPTTAITADPRTPIIEAADEVVVLDFADERSVVQTRFATSTLALLRASLGEDLTPIAQDAATASRSPLRDHLLTAEQITFLGTGWAYGLALEAALKMREAAGAWTEAYPTLEYWHGPISVTGPRRVTWMFGDPPAGLREAVADTGGAYVGDGLDPMAELVRAQRLAVHTARQRGLDPDQPRHLSRSVIRHSL